MKEWLLKDEEKNKVGRPKLADNVVVKRAKILVALSFIICFMLLFSFISIMNKTSPVKFAYSLTIEKLFGMAENSNGFIVKNYYDDDFNYVMEMKIPDNIDNYSGSYKYTTYYLKNDVWKEHETKELPRKTKNIKIKINSRKNVNVTWKIKLQIVNASKITYSYAPASWTYTDANNQEDKYTSKVFTVKGYYSPVSLEELKEDNTHKISISTDKKEPRIFILNIPNDNYIVKVKYTDSSSKSVLLDNENVSLKNKIYKVPNLNIGTIVTFNIWSNDGSSVEDYKLSNWKVKTDSKGKSYITNSYILKPEKNYTR